MIDNYTFILADINHDFVNFFFSHSKFFSVYNSNKIVRKGLITKQYEQCQFDLC